MGLPNSSGLFQELYDMMINNKKEQKHCHYGSNLEMSEEEKSISFLNRYFVFKKMKEESTSSSTFGLLF